LEENLFPHSRASENQAELEEERRLCYVAITRAEKYLYLTHAMKRRVYGEELPSEPSRFLNEFPYDLIEDQSKGPSWLRFANKTSTVENRQAPIRRRSNAQVITRARPTTTRTACANSLPGKARRLIPMFLSLVKANPKAAPKPAAVLQVVALQNAAADSALAHASVTQNSASV
jgi:DNA helicase-2/ATP-dependent DNA helicase PcrA